MEPRGEIRKTPKGKHIDPVEGWLGEVRRIAEATSYVEGVLTNITPGTDTYDEDNDFDLPSISPKAAAALKARFLYHIAVMLGDRGVWDSPTIAFMRESPKDKAVSIRVCRMSAAHQTPGQFALPQLVNSIGGILGRLHNYEGQIQASEDFDALWTTTVHLYKHRTTECIAAIKQLFSEHKARVDKFFLDTMGISDEVLMSLDHQVGDQLSAFHGLLEAVWRHGPTDLQLENIICQAHQMYSLGKENVKTRMFHIFGSVFGDALYEHLCTLAQPKRTFFTLVRTARALGTFQNVHLGLGLPQHRPRFLNPLSTPVRDPRLQSQTSDEPLLATEGVTPPLKRSNHTSQPHSTPSQNNLKIGFSPHTTAKPKAHLRTVNIGGLLPIARPYLSPEDRNLGLRALHPQSKRDAFVLIAELLGEQQPPSPSSSAYHPFGFPACRNEDETKLLAGLYHEIITTSRDKVIIFKDMWQACERNELPEFFDKHGWGCFRDEVPSLEGFLKKPFDQRESVYSLIQFLRMDGNTNPMPVLIRDYGFHLCLHRDQVESLKSIYLDTLKTIDPQELHIACVDGRLRETVTAAGVQYHERHRRLLQNQCTVTGIGFEKITCRFLRDQGLFKRQ